MDISPEWATHLMTHRDGTRVQLWWSAGKYQKVKSFSAVCDTIHSRSDWERQGWVFEEIVIYLENE
jgi:hypothetical protein